MDLGSHKLYGGHIAGQFLEARMILDADNAACAL